MDKVYCATVWFSTAAEQKSFAIAKGKNPKAIYTEGDGKEGWAACLGSFRDGGTLGLVGGLYIVGQNSNTLKKRLAEMRLAKVRPYNLETGETDGAKLYSEAMGSILGNRKFRGNKKKHKELSAKGGTVKGEKAQAQRNAILKEDIVRRLCECDEISWKKKASILGKPWTASSLFRQYGKK